jgi:hypothetical protein
VEGTQAKRKMNIEVNTAIKRDEINVFFVIAFILSR